MITKQELQRITKEKKMADISFMEKDYALTWALKAISENPLLSKSLIFKGGTCLSKIYAENYRLSEDLDFSTYKNTKVTPEEIKNELTNAFNKTKEIGSPELTIKSMHTNQGYIQFKVQYKAILEQAGTIKLDISLTEKVIYGSNILPVLELPYSDIESFKVHCYALQEIAVEKMRSLFQRGKSRDYYDIWKIMTTPNLEKKLMIQTTGLRSLLLEKCDLTDIPYKPELIFAQEQLQGAKDNWESSLGRMTVELPDFDKVINELKEVFFEENELSEFNKTINLTTSTKISFDNLDNIYRGEKIEGLLMRAGQLISKKLKSKNKTDVIKTLKFLEDLFMPAKKYASLLKIEKQTVIQLQSDKDSDIERLAKSVDNLTKLANINY